MSFADKAKNKAEELAGRAKEAVGDLTGNRDLQADGEEDQTRSKAKQTGEHLKDAATDAKDTLRDKR